MVYQEKKIKVASNPEYFSYYVIQQIGRMIVNHYRDPYFAGLSNFIIKNAGISETDPEKCKKQCEAIYFWVQEKIQYSHDPGGSEAIKTDKITSPKLIIQRGFGDCDDYTVVYCTLLEAIGRETRIITAGNEKYQKNKKVFIAYSHIFMKVKCLDNWYYLDGTLKGYPFGSIKPYKFISSWKLLDRKGNIKNE